MFTVAHATLNGVLSINQKSRGLNGGVNMLIGIAGGILLNSTVLQITRSIGGGNPYT